MLLGVSPLASAQEESGDGATDITSWIGENGTATASGTQSGAGTSASASDTVEAGMGFKGPFFDVHWTPACEGNSPSSQTDEMCVGAIAPCEALSAASGDNYVSMWQFRREVDASGDAVAGAGWEQVGTSCRGPNDPAMQNDGPSLAQLVLQEWKSVRIAEVSPIVQPAGGTLVNLPAIFHTDGAEQAFPVTILGRAVVLYAVPTEFVWHFGDGTSAETATPGSPYPSREVTRTYTQRGTYPVSVDVSFRGEFTVDGGARQPLPGTTTVAGPVSDFPVVESRTQLVSD